VTQVEIRTRVRVDGQDVVPFFEEARGRFFLCRSDSEYGGWSSPSRLSGMGRPQPLARQDLDCGAQPPGREISSDKGKTRKQYASGILIRKRNNVLKDHRCPTLATSLFLSLGRETTTAPFGHSDPECNEGVESAFRIFTPPGCPRSLAFGDRGAMRVPPPTPRHERRRSRSWPHRRCCGKLVKPLPRK
jgi:hypothetical protein